MFVLGLTVNEILTFEIFDLERSTSSDINFVMVSFISIGKYSNQQVVMCIFALVPTVLEILTFNIFTFKK